MICFNRLFHCYIHRYIQHLHFAAPFGRPRLDPAQKDAADILVDLRSRQIVFLYWIQVFARPSN
jgi:hypothetical protein